MKITTVKDSLKLSLPMPIFNSIHLADAIGRDGEEFEVFIGLNKNQVAQIKKLSLDPNDTELQINTGDKRRFGEGPYEDWYEKNRTPFCLIHKRTDALAALVWFGPKNLGEKSIKFEGNLGSGVQPRVLENWHTISCRSYRPFRGKGLMKNFTQFAMDIYKKQFPNVEFWGGMDDRNSVLVRLMNSLGFEMDREDSDLAQNWLIMTKK